MKPIATLDVHHNDFILSPANSCIYGFAGNAAIASSSHRTDNQKSSEEVRATLDLPITIRSISTPFDGRKVIL